MKYLLIGLVIGLLIPYIIQLFDLEMNNLANKQALKTSKIQKEMDELNPQYEIKEPCMGFQIPEPKEEYDEEED
jgi:uncharacterized membrane-anchored protein YhcB (DUF1043 family)